MYVSLDPKVKKPDVENYNFTTKFQKGGNFTGAKSLFLPTEIIQYFNPSCIDLGYAEKEPCVIYIGVFCSSTSECKGKLELEYGNYQPKQLVPGAIKHS